MAPNKQIMKIYFIEYLMILIWGLKCLLLFSINLVKFKIFDLRTFTTGNSHSSVCENTQKNCVSPD